MKPLIAKITFVFLIGYIGWMMWARKALWWGKKGDPHFVWPNSRWVFRDDEPGLYWFTIFWHGVIVAIMTYAMATAPG